MNIVARNRWGAPGGWRPLTPMRTPVRELWVHHGAGGQPNLATLRGYHRYHRSLGWAGLGYGYAITADGTVYEGRGAHVGAHTSGRNSISTAVVLVGNWSSGRVPDAMVRSLADLARHLAATGVLVSPTISGGHRQAPGQSTTCPGRAGLDAVDRARQLLAGAPPAAPALPPTSEEGEQMLKRGDSGNAVLAIQQAWNGWQLTRSAAAREGSLSLNGEFGPTMERCIRSYQRAANLEQTGRVDGLTAALLLPYR